MSDDVVTKEDLKQFSLLLLDKIESLLEKSSFVKSETNDPEWIKSKSVRKLLDISAGSVQNLRTTQKVRFKKVLGSYYYNRVDLEKLFTDEKR
ncbi:DNA-binding protein [Flavobacterium oncorhynchi]|uniref:DNA-binding protein n=3 Tax=Flavobacteriaceae TaxID=49546 RepID=A0A0D0EFT8_9FLAO|nr:hypothetical protein IW18_01350 [Flavobacterium hibernum]OXA84750.1 DNA-binding protein [Flavobacterium hibernum]OXB00136.1 DNA-binding protein [Flavobacterium oncorhynchi]STO18430.1 Uncharacterised protein [Flavobacterium hibernum]